MKKDNKKNGFTLLELVVAIAVFAVLMAVLIPAFTGMLRRAKLSADQVIVKNLNTIAFDNEHANGKCKLMRDAIEVAKRNGYLIENLTPEAEGALILWDSVNDRWFLFDEKNNKVIYQDKNYPLPSNVNIWKLGDTYTDSEIYSVYLKDGYSGATTLNINTGLDVGNNTNVNEIVYTNTSGSSPNVVIYTNGGTLTVNAPNDTVNHYGNAVLVDINAVASSSYHEFGQVDSAQIKVGRIVIENKEASIENLLLIAKSDKSGFEEIIVETKVGAEMPTLDRTDVNIAANGTLVLNVVTPSSDEYIYLTKAGVVEQIVVTTEEVNTATTNVTAADSAKVASETSENTYAVAEQIANVGMKNDNGDYVDSNNNIIIYANGEIAEGKDPSTIVVEKKIDNATAEEGLNLFTGGYGTKTSPYLISNVDQLRNISELCYLGKMGNEHFASGKVYYKLINDINIPLDYPKYTAHRDPNKYRNEIIFIWGQYQQFDIDLDGHTIEGINRELIGYTEYLNMHDGTLSFLSTNYRSPCVINTIFGDSANPEEIVFKNLTLTGNVVGGVGDHYGPLVLYADGQNGINYQYVTITCDNIISNMYISNSTSNAYTGGLIGYALGGKLTVSITNCTFNGTIQSARAGGFINPCSYPKTVVSSNNILNGNIFGTNVAISFGLNQGNFNGDFNAIQASVISTFAHVGLATPSVLFNNNNAQIGDEISINHTNSNIAYYVVNISVITNNISTGLGGYPRTISTTINVENSSENQTIQTGMFKNKVIQTSTLNTSKENLLEGVNGEYIWLDGDTYYYYTSGNIVLSEPGKVIINIYGYNENNSLITYQNCSFTHK